MKIVYRNLVSFVILCLLASSAWAQQFKTHAVKDGETLAGIARQYGVSTQQILKYNKELGGGNALRPNTILVIPMGGEEPLTEGNDTGGQDAEEEVAEPIGFTQHKVKKRETLYGIAQRYHITENDIKRYNKDLYSQQLKKGMELTIPKYLRQAPQEDEVLLEEGQFERYTVKPKETRWSIANRYGITMDSLLVLNPDLSQTEDDLRIGQELRLPILPGSSIEGQQVQLYTSYTVPAQMTYYSLEKKFGVDAETVKELNPEVRQRGLQQGMVIRLPNPEAAPKEVNTDNFIFYEVKPKQTEYALTRMFGISYTELLALNPDLQDGLKAGMVLKLPITTTGNFDVHNSLVLDRINLVDSINQMNRPHVMLLLPFRVDKVDMANKEAAVKTIQARNDIKYALGLYSGALMAVDSLERLGVNAQLSVYDTQRDMAKVRSILSSSNLGGVDAIIGPLDPKLLKEVAVQASRYQIPVIAPIADKSDISLGNVFFSIPSEEVLRQMMLRYLVATYQDENIIVIADSRNKNEQNQIMTLFPGSKTIGLTDDLSLDIEKFNPLLSTEKENWVFLETDNFKVVSSVSSILNSSISEEVKLKMFTTDKNKAFENSVISNSHLSRLQFTYPHVDRPIQQPFFSKGYDKRFGTEPDKYAVRGFDLTMDTFLKLAYIQDLFRVSGLVGGTEYLGNKFSYDKQGASGYFNQSGYIVKFDNMRLKQVTGAPDKSTEENTQNDR